MGDRIPRRGGPLGPPRADLYPPRRARVGPYVTLLLAIWAGQAILSFTGDRKTAHFDEQIHLAHGYIYWTEGEYRLGPDTAPPLMNLVLAAPLLLMDLRLPDGWRTLDKWTLGDRFVNQNTAPAGRILFRARMMVVLVGLGLGWLIFRVGTTLGGPAAGLAALALYAFDPLHLSRAWFAGMDLAVTALAFAASWMWWRALLGGRARTAALAGALTGAALAVKFTAVFLLPAHALLALAAWRLHRADLRVILRRVGLAALAAIGVIALAYQGHALPRFFETLASQMGKAGSGGFHGFFNGRYSATGWWYFYPVAFAVKTPLPVVAVALAGLWTISRSAALRTQLPFLLIPPATLFLLACRSSIQLGLRYILPVYPFLLILGGIGLARLAIRASGSLRRGGAVLAAGLLAWQAWGALRVFPEYELFYNEAAGPKAYRCVFDPDTGENFRAWRAFLSTHPVRRLWAVNFNWGSVRSTAAEVDGRAFAAELGVTPPSGAGRDYALVPVLALYARPDPNGVDHLAWLDALQPAARVGYRFAFDLTDVPDSAARLAGLDR